MNDADVRELLTETQAMVGLLTDLVYDATIRVEVLTAFLVANGVHADQIERVFRQTKADYESRLKHVGSDLRTRAILKYIEGDEKPPQ